MFRTIAGLVLAAVFAALGCTTPSVHPVYTDDSLVTDAGVVGTWKTGDDKATYEVTRAGDGYHLLVKSNDPTEPKQWEFSVKLTQIGPHRFADVTVVSTERDAHEDRWGPLFIPTHLFCRYTLEGDALDIWMLNLKWFRTATADGTASLGSTFLNKQTTLITAETPDLRAFLEKFGGDGAAFADHSRLERVKP